MSGVDPVFEECYRSFPDRPDIDVATTVYTREQLEARIDFWMRQLIALTRRGQEL